MSPVKKKVTYLSNKELLLEIHNSKKSFCTFLENNFSDYDFIIMDPLLKLEDLIKHRETPLEDKEKYKKQLTFVCKKTIDERIRPLIMDKENIQKAKEQRSNRLYEKHLRHLTFIQNVPQKEAMVIAKNETVDPTTIKDGEIVYRVMTKEHIPFIIKPNKKKEYSRVNFPPFMHYVIEKVGRKKVLKLVGKSHWVGDFDSEGFTTTKGKMTEKLGYMLHMLVDKYSQSSNWRGYSYVDEMKGSALLQLSSTALMFNEFKGSNPFAFYTQVISNSFTGILNEEKKYRTLKDELIQDAGYSPSFNAQVEHEMAIRESSKDD